MFPVSDYELERCADSVSLPLHQKQKISCKIIDKKIMPCTWAWICMTDLSVRPVALAPHTTKFWAWIVAVPYTILCTTAA